MISLPLLWFALTWGSSVLDAQHLSLIQFHYVLSSPVACVLVLKRIVSWAPKGFGDLGRKAISFQGVGSTGNYFRGSGEHALGI